MKKKYQLLLIGMMIVFSGCSLYGNSSAPTKTSQPATPSSSTATKEVGNAVSIENFAFSPKVLNVSVGTTVTWTNKDSATHIIKSTTFNSSSLAKGETFQFTFSTPGTFDYFCSIHPSMQGQIVVK